jgi:hypothetical protein
LWNAWIFRVFSGIHELSVYFTNCVHCWRNLMKCSNYWRNWRIIDEMYRFPIDYSGKMPYFGNTSFATFCLFIFCPLPRYYPTRKKRRLEFFHSEVFWVCPFVNKKKKLAAVSSSAVASLVVNLWINNCRRIVHRFSRIVNRFLRILEMLRNCHRFQNSSWIFH